MSADIHILRGGAKIASPGKTDANVVAEMEWLLEAAKSGRITGIAYAFNSGDGSTSNRYVGEISLRQVGALFSVMGRVSQQLDSA